MTDEERESKQQSLELFEEKKREMNLRGVETPSLDRMIELLKKLLRENK